MKALSLTGRGRSNPDLSSRAKQPFAVSRFACPGRVGLDPDAAAVGLDEFLVDGEAEAGVAIGSRGTSCSGQNARWGVGNSYFTSESIRPALIPGQGANGSLFVTGQARGSARAVPGLSLAVRRHPSGGGIFCPAMGGREKYRRVRGRRSLCWTRSAPCGGAGGGNRAFSPSARRDILGGCGCPICPTPFGDLCWRV